jgi:hypothetical protein
MIHHRSLFAGGLAGIVVAFLAILQLGAAEQQEPQVGNLPLGEKVLVFCTGGVNFVGPLVAHDSDWLVLSRGESKVWLSKPQIVSVQHPVPTANRSAER